MSSEMKATGKLTALQTLIKFAVEENNIYIDRRNGRMVLETTSYLSSLIKKITKLHLEEIIQNIMKMLNRHTITIDIPPGKIKDSILEILRHKNIYFNILKSHGFPINKENKAQEEFNEPIEHSHYQKELKSQKNKFIELARLNNLKYNKKDSILESKPNILLTKEDLNFNSYNICHILGYDQNFYDYLMSINKVKGAIKIDTKKGCLIINLNYYQAFIKRETLNYFAKIFNAINNIFYNYLIEVKEICDTPITIAYLIDFILSLESILNSQTYSHKERLKLEKIEGFLYAEQFIKKKHSLITNKINSELVKNCFIKKGQKIISKQYHELTPENISIDTILNLFSPKYDDSSNQSLCMNPKNALVFEGTPLTNANVDPDFYKAAGSVFYPDHLRV